ncbi:MAG TPA: ribosome maturation factor RimP [Elusimicrobiota bacterium]|nr:ribosome maturation factor RimP [Elusimicrobiota bacterium]
METEKLEEIIAPLVEQESAELVDLTLVRGGPRWILRVTLDKEGGITLDDCAYFSDRIGSLLDSTNAVERSYVLEVSSPGLDRIIKKEKDFIRFSGKMVRVELKQNFQGRRKFRGELKGYRDGKVLVACGEETLEFPRPAIDEVRLDLAAEL